MMVRRSEAGRKPVEMFLTTQSGNSTQLLVYCGSSESKSLPSTSVFLEPARIWGFLRVPLFMIFPQVNSTPRGGISDRAHTPMSEMKCGLLQEAPFAAPNRTANV